MTPIATAPAVSSRPALTHQPFSAYEQNDTHIHLFSGAAFRNLSKPFDNTWDDASSPLTIGVREGRFPGMLGERDFIILLPGAEPQTVHYDGRGEVTVRAL